MIRTYGWGIRVRDGEWEERLLRDYAFAHGAIVFVWTPWPRGTVTLVVEPAGT